MGPKGQEADEERNVTVCGNTLEIGPSQVEIAWSPENKVSGVWVQLASIETETGVHVCGAIRASRRQRSVPLLSAWPFVGMDLLESLPRDF